MAVIKKAKWVEGITQSKRILRDLAEIATTAIKDENGVVPEENWQLVFPRPFDEEPVEGGVLMQDTVNPKKYIPVRSHAETITLNGTVPVALKNTDGILEQSIVVKNDTTTYVNGTDYVYDPAAHTIARTSGSSIPDGAVVSVTYGTTFTKILQSMPVTVYRQLTLAEPDRVIDPALYDIIDYTAGKIKFNTDPPTDGMYFALTFTEYTGTFGRILREKVQLIPDVLDPTGRTFQLPAGTGAIMKSPETRTIASTVSGGTGSNPNGTFTYTVDPDTETVVFSEAPVLTEDDFLSFVGYFYDTPALDHVTDTPYTAVLQKDASDATGKTYKIVHPYVKVNINKTHQIDFTTKNTAPVLYKHLDPESAGWEVVPYPNEYAIDFDNPAITFVNDQTQALKIDFVARGEDDLQVGLSKITDRIVLKTITKPENEVTPVIGDNYGAKDTATELEMYVEFYKPPKLIHPETGLERYTLVNGSQATTQDNNHFIQVRMFDRWNDRTQRAQEPVYDTSGKLIDRGAYISDWAKFSWFRDWKEYLVDELDIDPGISNTDDGVILQQVETRGMSDECPIQFWISTNNNRIAMVLMGDPALDQDNFLTSFGYFGRISPFYTSECVVKRDAQGSIVLDANGDPVLEEKRTYFENDVSGNFAITVGSSTIPADIGQPPKGVPILHSVEVALDADGNLVSGGTLWDMTYYGYAVSYLTEGGESQPTPINTTAMMYVRAKTVNPNMTGGNVATQGLTMKIRFTLPQEATGYKIYRAHYVTSYSTSPGVSQFMPKHENYKLVTTVKKLDTVERTFEFIDDGTMLTMSKTGTGVTTYYTASNDQFYKNIPSAAPQARSFESVVRDRYTGAILDVKFTQKWGANTATGVNDIMMYQTRSGLKYQRHQAAFITTEEFMRKEKSGQSRWTGKFHLSPIYVEHSYDKQRGWLDGVMAVDDSGIEHLDELIVDKDTPNEEVYKFFRINAPYSFLNNSPNYAYGVAIIKSSQKWK